MLGLLYLAPIVLWLVCVLLISRWVYRRKESRLLQFLATILALWVPLWDVLPGYLQYSNAVKEIGGVRIRHTVHAEGYLDHIQRECWRYLTSSPYAYCENQSGDWNQSLLGALNAKAGYYEYRLSPIDSPDCAPFREHFNVEAMQSTYRLGPRCVVAKRRDAPISRYEFSSGSKWLPSIWPIPPTYASWFRVQDRLTGETIAQATQLRYRIWISQVTRLPLGWSYRRDGNGNPIRLSPQDVIQPK